MWCNEKGRRGAGVECPACELVSVADTHLQERRLLSSAEDKSRLSLVDLVQVNAARRKLLLGRRLGSRFSRRFGGGFAGSFCIRRRRISSRSGFDFFRDGRDGHQHRVFLALGDKFHALWQRDVFDVQRAAFFQGAQIDVDEFRDVRREAGDVSSVITWLTRQFSVLTAGDSSSPL